MGLAKNVHTDLPQGVRGQRSPIYDPTEPRQSVPFPIYLKRAQSKPPAFHLPDQVRPESGGIALTEYGDASHHVFATPLPNSPCSRPKRFETADTSNNP